jgi:hypothetical protein
MNQDTFSRADDDVEGSHDEDGLEDEGDADDRHWLAAAGQKIVIYSILLNFVLNALQRSQLLSGYWLASLFLCVAVFALVGVLKICSGLGKSQNQKIVFMVLSFIPLVNIFALVYLSMKTSKMLREAGWEVGLLGARP